MKTHEKLKQMLKDAGITLKDLHERQQLLFPPKACLSLYAYRKILNGESSPRFSTLLKLCQLLEVSLLELIEDTDFSDIFLIRKGHRPDSFTYNDKVSADIVTSPACPFISMELVIKPGGVTNLEKSPSDKKYEKSVYVMEGRLKLFIDNVEYNLQRKDSVTFNSSKPHYFQNAHSRKCACLVTLFPKHF